MSARISVAPVVGSTQLQEALHAGLSQVEERISASLLSEDEFISRASAHLNAAGGKRFRPLLTLMVAQLGSGTSPQIVDAAAAVELIHLASLYHDDVMDEASVRRGAPSANAKYDNSTAILVGDLLFGHASALVADLGPEAVRIQAETFIRLCSGQIRDERPCPEGADPIEYYLQVLSDKTGVLIATAARYGAMLSGCDEAVITIVREYGEKLGMAFQLADDLLDVSADEKTLGKEPGTDLREGKRTLPVLYALASTDPADARLQQLLRADLSSDPAGVSEALELLRSNAALDEARAATRAVAQQATELLAPLPEGAVKEALTALAASSVERVS